MVPAAATGIPDTPIQEAATVTLAAVPTQAEVTQAAVEVTMVAADVATTAGEATMEAVDTTAASDLGTTADLTHTVLATAILPATTIRTVIGIHTRAAQCIPVTK